MSDIVVLKTYVLLSPLLLLLTLYVTVRAAHWLDQREERRIRRLRDRAADWGAHLN